MLLTTSCRSPCLVKLQKLYPWRCLRTTNWRQKHQFHRTLSRRRPAWFRQAIAHDFASSYAFNIRYIHPYQYLSIWWICEYKYKYIYNYKYTLYIYIYIVVSPKSHPLVVVGLPLISKCPGSPGGFGRVSEGTLDAPCIAPTKHMVI